MRQQPQDLLGSSSAVFAAEATLLAAEALRTSGRLRLRVHGESMLPTLWPCDVTEIAGCSVGDLRGGEIVLALRDGRFFLHRFLRITASGFVLQGDSMPHPDPEFPSTALLGRLVGFQPASIGSVNGRAATSANSSSTPLLPLRPSTRLLGKILCYCGPARRLALRLHAARERSRHVNEPQASSVDGLVDVPHS